jgi:thioredoxin 1
MEKKLTDANFKEEVINSEETCLVDFWAPWCGPCLRVAPHISEIAKEYQGKLKVGKLNVDEEASTAMMYNISSIPTLLVFKDGEIVERIIGAYPKSEIEKVLQPHI